MTLIYLVLTVIWFVFMTYLSHQDGEHTNYSSRILADKLKFLDSNVNALNSKLRRFAHIFVFGILTILIGLTLRSIGVSIWYELSVVIWAWGDERTKTMIEGRHFSWFDVGLNLLGFAIGAVLLMII